MGVGGGRKKSGGRCSGDYTATLPSFLFSQQEEIIIHAQMFSLPLSGAG
jgi:hypothetical protein